MTSGKIRGQLYILLLAFLLLPTFFFSTITNAGEAKYIAGVEPDRRRADIPVITKTNKDSTWQKRALSGLSQPYPEHVLQFLKDQGNWFSPFMHPGMPNLYDIRNWHKSKKE